MNSHWELYLERDVKLVHTLAILLLPIVSGCFLGGPEEQM